MDILLKYDTLVFVFINKNLHNIFFDKVMPFVSYLGRGELIVITGLLLLIFKDKKLKLAGLALIAGSTLCYYTSEMLKPLFARPRPFETLKDVIILAKTTGFSLPSGHSMMAFMAATILANKFKKYLLFFILSFFVAFSRIYLGVHYPSDTAAGAAIGILIGFLLVKITE